MYHMFKCNLILYHSYKRILTNMRASWMDEGIPDCSSYLPLGNSKFLWHGLIMSSIEVLHNFQGPPHHSTLVSDLLKKVFGITQPTQCFIWHKLESRCSLSSQIGDVLHNPEVD